MLLALSFSAEVDLRTSVTDGTSVFARTQKGTITISGTVTASHLLRNM